MLNARPLAAAMAADLGFLTAGDLLGILVYWRTPVRQVRWCRLRTTVLLRQNGYLRRGTPKKVS